MDRLVGDVAVNRDHCVAVHVVVSTVAAAIDGIDIRTAGDFDVGMDIESIQ